VSPEPQGDEVYRRHMKVRVKLYGTLSRKFPGHDPARGLEVELPEGATVGELLAQLGLDRAGGVVIADNLIRRQEDPLWDGASVYVLQPVHGG
jgi:sulfur carrier protein ThiS